MNGVRGYVVCGRGAYASNSIFLPCVGVVRGTRCYGAGSYGYYWSSVPDSNYYDSSWYLIFDSRSPVTDSGTRFYGRPVRPVQGFAK